MKRTRSDECLSDLVLDRLELAALGESEARSAAAHLEACARCASRRAALQGEAAGQIPAYDDVLARAAERARAAPPSRKPVGRRLAPFVGALALGAALLLFVRA
ncbi:MAG TPA: DUF4384 domain-containing protein, partial [Labilithrix sp.]|nr:DUF4384 domain-containing protein [Labilithrix sp.]